MDHTDFATFQLCLTDVDVPVIPTDPAYCACYDVEGDIDGPDGDIDQADLTVFAACVSAPDVPATPNWNN